MEGRIAIEKEKTCYRTANYYPMKCFGHFPKRKKRISKDILYYLVCR